MSFILDPHSDSLCLGTTPPSSVDKLVLLFEPVDPHLESSNLHRSGEMFLAILTRQLICFLQLNCNTYLFGRHQKFVAEFQLILHLLDLLLDAETVLDQVLTFFIETLDECSWSLDKGGAGQWLEVFPFGHVEG